MALHHAPARLFKISDQPAGQHCRKFRIDQVIRVQNPFTYCAYPKESVIN